MNNYFSRKEMIKILANYFNVCEKHFKRLVKDNNINVEKFYYLIDKSDLRKSRDEFYSFFKDESIADIYWDRCWEEH